MRTRACSISATARRSASRSRVTTIRPQVEILQGAATGVGGNPARHHRDGRLADRARRTALRARRSRFDRAVAGIGAYGNSVGVPTVGGEAVFDDAYRDNVLVNAMCVGLLPADRIARAGRPAPATSSSSTARRRGGTGIGGASVLASQEAGRNDADKRPTMQVGDPFLGKKLIEVSVELVESGLVESLQIEPPGSRPRSRRWRGVRDRPSPGCRPAPRGGDGSRGR